MTDCPHTPKYPDLSSVPTMQEAMSHCTLVEDQPDVAKQRALTSADGATTRIDTPYWHKLNDAQRAAVVAHERAHPQIGMGVDCEGCADKVGGYTMRAWGYAPDVVQNAFSTLRVARKQDHGQIGDNAKVGAQAAEQGLASRGLLGAPSSVVASNLLASRAAAQAALAKAGPKTQTTSPVVATHPLTAQPRTPVVPAETATAAQGSEPSTAPASGSVAADGVPAAAAQLDAGGPGSAPATQPISASAPLPVGPLAGPPPVNGAASSQVATPTTPTDGTDVAGDIVSAVLGESARPHAIPVLIAAGVAATIAVVLVILVRRASK